MQAAKTAELCKMKLTVDTFPVPVKINVSGPSDSGIMPRAISYPASLMAP